MVVIWYYFLDGFAVPRTRPAKPVFERNRASSLAFRTRELMSQRFSLTAGGPRIQYSGGERRLRRGQMPGGRSPMRLRRDREIEVIA